MDVGRGGSRGSRVFRGMLDDGFSSFFEGSSRVAEKADKTPMNSGKVYVLKKSRLEKYLSLY